MNDRTGELHFENVIGTYNALWEIGGRIATEQPVGNANDWLGVFRMGLRGMLARVISVDREYVELHRFRSQWRNEGNNPNEWAVRCESHAGVIFFSMDSALECFVFAMNAIGFAKTPQDFCDITDPRALRQIGPKNILGGDASDKLNPRPGYGLVFPGVVSCWTKYRDVLLTIFEYHDVSKHRSAVSTGGRDGVLHVRADPKLPGSLMSSAEHTVESLGSQFQILIDELLPVATGEVAAAYGYSVVKTSAG